MYQITRRHIVPNHTTPHCTKSHDVTFRYIPVRVTVDEIKGMSWAEHIALMGGIKLSLVPAGSAKILPYIPEVINPPKYVYI
jgi:hypothetical protein